MKFKNVDLFVYLCIHDKNITTIKDISNFVKIDKSIVSKSINVLIDGLKIEKFGKGNPYQYRSINVDDDNFECFKKKKKLDNLVYDCINKKNIHTCKEISVKLSVDTYRIYLSISKLLKQDKVIKLENTLPCEYFVNYKMEENNKNYDDLKKDPEMALDIFVNAMSKRLFRKFIFRLVLEKSARNDAHKEWKTITLEEKRGWVRLFFFDDKNNLDVFVNACFMLKDTKNEKAMLEYIVKNLK